MKRRKGLPRKRPSKAKTIYLVGEGTGETITKIAKASLAQFSGEKVKVKTFFQVKKKDRIRQIVKKASEDEALVAFSVILQPTIPQHNLKA